MDFREYFKRTYTDKSLEESAGAQDCTLSIGSSDSDMTSVNAPLDASNLYHEYFNAAEAATERVATLINSDFECKDLFCQMDMLRSFKNELVWKEMARWIRYEEAVEEGGERWSKPHVASLMMEALQDLQSILSTCPVIMNCKAKTMADIAEVVTNEWIKERAILSLLKERLVSVLLRPHKFQHYKRGDMKKRIASSSNLQKMNNGNEAYVNKAYQPGDSLHVPNSLKSTTCPDSPSLALGEMNKSFMRKIPHGSEVVNLLVGEINELDKIIAVFVRLQDPCNLGDITEVDLNTKFMFIVLGPKTHLGHCAEMCRCMAALFTDQIFRCCAYRADDRIDLLCGIQEFSLHLTVLPPGVWNPGTRIEPPDELPSQNYRIGPGTMTSSKSATSICDIDKKSDNEQEEEESHSDPTLVRTGRLFGGLINDVKRKVPFYLSDIKDYLHIHCVASFLFLATLTANMTFGGLFGQAKDQYMAYTSVDIIFLGLFGGLVNDIKRKVPFYLSDIKDSLHIQCVASFFFLFLATLTPNVTFGGLLGQATDQYMGTMECILAAAISGVMFALFAGQPLNILGSTGPMLVLEGILFRFCKDQDWDFLPFRVWVGFWTGFFILLIVAFDLSALVRYITRFTEESFACLIALIFIFEAFKKTFEIEKHAPVHFSPPSSSQGCFCVLDNSSIGSTTPPLISTTGNDTFTTVAALFTNMTTSISNYTNITSTTTPTPKFGFELECSNLGGRIAGGQCEEEYVPDVFFFSLVLFFGTFLLANVLVHFRHSLFFPTFVRQNVSDFAVLISIIAMVALDASCGLPTPKLLVPEEFKPTKPGRPWFINPISEKNPWWLMLLSALPAILATILIFMDQQITAVIVNRRENKLKKGSGYHLDMMIVGVLVVVLGLLGLPWYVAATVTALAHIMSLKKVSECTAPGEKPVFLGVREQRVTSFLVGIFSGLAVLITSVLRYIPMPVLYGVFLYMGVAPLGGMQLIQRILIMFMPAKYQPDYSFVRNVPIRRVHMFTGIQVLCLAGLWVVKSVKSISIAFPLMVLIICFVRKALDKLFTQRELKWLDDILPATHVEKEDKETELQMKKMDIMDEPVLIKVTTDIDADNQPSKTSIGRALSAPEAENGEVPSHEALKPRMSLTFICKTDIDRIKQMTPEVATDRRMSLIAANERKRSVGSIPGQAASRRKFSSPLMLARKLSVEHYASPFHPPSVEEHNKLNKMLSLPATIADENENEDGNDQD